MGDINPPLNSVNFYPYDPRVQAIGLGLRKVVLEEMAPCHEYIFPMRSKVVLLYSSSERVLADCVCSIAIFRRHATLIFHHGVDLKDTHHLLQGTGKALRHIRVEHLEELDRRELRTYLREARRRSPLKGQTRTMPRDVVTRVKRKPATRPVFQRMY
jgi:hypothetical protein